MERIESATPARAARPGRNRVRHRSLAALGFIALPLVGSAFVIPAVANASDTDSAQPAPAPVAAVEALAPASYTAVPRDAGIPTMSSDEALVQAFYTGGYTYDDAVALADRWGVPESPYQAKIKAGAYLVQGVALRDSPYADPTADDALSPDELIDVFLGSGYTFEDATVLSEAWGLGVSETKTKAGSELKTVGSLPFVDPASSPGVDTAAVDAFFAAGYDVDDAVELAGFWSLATPYDAKVKAGTLLLAGDPLPAMAGLDS